MRFSPPFAEFALEQHDLEALLACATVSHLGFLVALVRDRHA